MGRKKAELPDIIDKEYNDWTVVRFSHYGKPQKNGYCPRFWFCRCKCGAEQQVSETNFKYGSSKRCIKCGLEKSKKKRERWKNYGMKKGDFS